MAITSDRARSIIVAVVIAAAGGALGWWAADAWRGNPKLIVITGSRPAGLYLTWRADPTTTMTVNWVDPESANQIVWYRSHVADDAVVEPAGSAAKWASATSTSRTLGETSWAVRHAALGGLSPDTLYEFAISPTAPTRFDPLYRFRTMPSTLSRPVRFVEGGDMMHRRDWADAMNRRAAELDPDFIMLGGDLAYADGGKTERWFDWLASMKQNCVARGGRLIPLVVAIGNHDVDGGFGQAGDAAPLFHELFDTPADRTSYTLDFGDYLSVVVLDSDNTQRIEGAQTEWLARELESRRDRPLVYALYHFPAYGTVKGPDGDPSEHPRSVSIRANWVPLFERYGVDVCFEHDNHTYKRTHPIRAGRIDPERGIVYLGDGAWGVRPRKVPVDGSVWYLAHAESRRHVIHGTIDRRGQRFEAVDVDGAVFDTLELPAEPRLGGG